MRLGTGLSRMRHHLDDIDKKSKPKDDMPDWWISSNWIDSDDDDTSDDDTSDDDTNNDNADDENNDDVDLIDSHPIFVNSVCRHV